MNASRFHPISLGILVVVSLFSLSASYAQPLAKSTPRIVGGEPAPRGLYPWIAALVRRDDAQPKPISPLEGQFCAGTLIHPRWVLTAAHCLQNGWGIPLLKGELDVILGLHNLATDIGERAHVKNVVVHPNFDPYRVDNDIGLLELEQPVTWPTIQLASSHNASLPEGTLVTTLGWGDTSTVAYRPTFFNELRHVQLPLISNETCQNAATQLGFGNVINTTEMCAGFAEGGKDTCYGDSGGPVVMLNHKGDGWQQIGIVSYGMHENCGNPGNYGVYTRISAYRDFIESYLCQPVFNIDVLFTNPILPPPHLEVSVKNHVVTANWSSLEMAKGYELYYAPYPSGVPVYSWDVGEATTLSFPLGSGQNYYLAVRAYNGICNGDFSNTTFFVIP